MRTMPGRGTPDTRRPVGRFLVAAQRFLAAFSGISPHFRLGRHQRTEPDHRLEMTVRFTIWDGGMELQSTVHSFRT
ncbi:hypothetical protein [Streptomyces sp. B21-083]|uniref:hypothetical protein n=1 Tax=Streptomyces sp. B21-083 TaxID=3039410 RepID=UPI002FF19708